MSPTVEDEMKALNETFKWKPLFISTSQEYDQKVLEKIETPIFGLVYMALVQHFRKENPFKFINLG